MSYPRRPQVLYGFSSYQANNPAAPVPGDRLDVQYAEHAGVLNEVIDFLRHGHLSDGSPVGKGLRIAGLGYSLDDLPADGAAVDGAYVISGVLYVWDTAAATWIPVGTVTGPAGPPGPKGETGDFGATDFTTELYDTVNVAAQTNSLIRDPRLLSFGVAGAWERAGAQGAVIETTQINGDVAIGKSIQFDVTSTQDDEVRTQSNGSVWAAPEDPTSLRVEVDYVLGSGGLGGAGVIAEWVNGAGDVFPASIALSAMALAGEGGVTRRAAVLDRPVGFTGAFGYLRLRVCANAASGFGTRETKSIRFDRVAAFTQASSQIVSWAGVTEKPLAFAPSAHTHPWAEVTDTPTTFPPSSHTHTGGQITDIASYVYLHGDPRYAPAGSAWPGRYTGNNAWHLDYPIGTTLLVRCRSVNNNTYVALNNEGIGFGLGPGANTLVGTWACRGNTIYNDHGQLFQRVT